MLVDVLDVVVAKMPETQESFDDQMQNDSEAEANKQIAHVNLSLKLICSSSTAAAAVAAAVAVNNARSNDDDDTLINCIPDYSCY
uniref:Uncharacterized protein n=1 Tax=Syphacia muris TaxID=451379 RepID=A0A0N5AKK5_9BILA